MAVERSRIREQYLFGTRFANEASGRMAESIRCYEGQWSVFFFQDGKQISLGFNSPYMTQADANAQAIDFCKTGALPDAD